MSTEDGSRGIHGRVTDLLPRYLGPNVEVYTCGPDRMMAAVAERCALQAVACEVSLEAPMACGFGICLGCAVPTPGGGYLYACAEGPCIDAQRIDWNRSRDLSSTVSKGGGK
jgi:dihydroorotate dehydrogenase electron transfer subunit